MVVPKIRSFKSGVSVRAHHHQIGLERTRRANDFGSRAASVSDSEVGFQAVFLQRIHDVLEVLLTGGDFGGGRQRSEQLAGGAFFDVQQVDGGSMQARHGGSVSDRGAIAIGMIERNQDGAVAESRKIGGHGSTGMARRNRLRPRTGERHPAEQNHDCQHRRE